MTASSAVFRVGTRTSKLARIQTRFALDRLAGCVPGLRFEEVLFSSPGDRDQATDLRQSPPDFFTRDLDEAVRSGALDAAIHSAKDMPDTDPDGLDWFWLPWREDPRDALVLAPGRRIRDLPRNPVAGVSSDRREDWCRARFPGADLRPIRGTIEQRLAQLDEGRYDLLVMAGAALLRLGLEDRITEWIPLADLPAPDGQGVLGLTFRANDARFRRLRSLFVKAVVLAGAGAGGADQATRACVAALARADVCLHDALMDPALLDLLSPGAERVDVGKRCGEHGRGQNAIVAELLRQARRGRRVVRLKGGDPGLFGRLAEETDALEAYGLPFRVLPGISSLQAATTATGLLLTRRGVSRGFCAMTPREQAGGVGSIRADVRTSLPLVLFMALRVARQAADQLRADGWPDTIPAAAVLDAGSENETILHATLATLPEALAAENPDRPGLLIFGEAARRAFDRTLGALAGRRVLLTCSAAIMDRAAASVLDLGGVPVRRPLVRLVPCPDAADRLKDLDRYDWVILTSPSAVQALFEVMEQARLDVRLLPRILVCGPGTAAALAVRGLQPDAAPDSDFSAAGLCAILPRHVRPGQHVLRLRSDQAGRELADALSPLGAVVEDAVLYRNEPVAYDALPAFDAAVLASASAVDRLVEWAGVAALAGKDLAVIGKPTAAALRRHGLAPAAVAAEGTIEAAVFALAAEWVKREL